MKSKQRVSRALLSVEDHERIKKVMVARDAQNNGMTCNKALDVICCVAGCTKKQADNYYNNATKQGKFKYLKCGGRVSTAQKTTTSQTQIHMPHGTTVSMAYDR